MVIKVYMSGISGNKEIKKKQEFLFMILEGQKIDFERIDITDPANDEQKQFMRDNATPKEGQNVPLPPQIFNEDQYCGDYERFHESNEDDQLYEFLKLAPPKQLASTEVTLSDLNGNMNKKAELEDPSLSDNNSDQPCEQTADGAE